MKSTQEETQSQEFYQQLVKEAWQNEGFKHELTTNPLQAIEKLTGKKPNVPEGKYLVVCDQTAEDSIFINIPRRFDFSDVELSEEQLEVISGGEEEPFFYQWGQMSALNLKIAWAYITQ